jgi:type IV secretory pathway TrbF-like protein
MTSLGQMILTAVCSSGLTGAVIELIKFFVNRHDNRYDCEAEMKDDMQEIKNELQNLINEIKELKEDDIVTMHDRIYQAFRYMKDMKTITPTDRANIDYLAERYFKRGGNHKAKIMYNIICKIPVVYKSDDYEKTDV